MNDLASRRGRAYARDCLVYLAIAAATLPFGLVTYAAGWGQHQPFVLAMSSIAPVLATLLAARQESGAAAATPGKRRYGLVVTDRHGSHIRLGRGLVRNAVKIGVPWQIGHTVAVGAANGGFEDMDPLTIGAAVIAYPLIGMMIASVVWNQGIAIHDRVAQTRVRATTEDRSAIEPGLT